MKNEISNEGSHRNLPRNPFRQKIGTLGEIYEGYTDQKKIHAGEHHTLLYHAAYLKNTHENQLQCRNVAE